MIRNYIKTALRHFSRQKGFSFINMFGLTLGLACCIVIFLFVSDETSFDNFHTERNLIYRVAVRTENPNLTSYSATVCAPVAQVLRDNFPQVDKVAQVFRVDGGFMEKNGIKYFEDSRIFADPEIFQILSIPFLKGDPITSLDRPGTMVLSERMVKKYFGQDEPIGQTIQFNSRDYEVTGVVADSRDNTHLKYDTFISMKTLEGRYPFDRWFLSNFYIYVKLFPNVDTAELAVPLASMAHTYAPKELVRSDEKIDYFLQPVEDIHILSHLRNETEPGMNPLYLYLFSGIGLFVLLIACMNFINLSTARATKRAREVGIRKVVGAHRNQLIRQFMSESFVIIVFALVFSLLTVGLLLPVVNSITGKSFVEADLFQWPLVLFMGILLIFVSFVASAYPAFFLSQFLPVKVLHSNAPRGQGSSMMRKILVVGQFAISIALIAGTLVMFHQINFMKNTYLGFDKEQKLIIPVRGNLSIEDNYEMIKTSFLTHPSISGSTVSSHVLGERLGRWDTELAGGGEQDSRVLNHLYVGPDFIEEYGIRMVAGRDFSTDFSTDREKTMIINQSAAAEYGWTPEEALGKRLESIVSGEVIGVIEDFHYQGLQTDIEPLALFWIPENFENITLNLNTTSLSETLAFVKNKWEDIYPGYPLEYFFLDSNFDKEYQSEDRVRKMFTGFTLLGVVIACLGLFGLASFTAEQKTKEIGVRKVLGASVSEIVLLLSKETLKWVLLANLIAWPIVYLSMNSWLKSFAYRIDVGAGILVTSAGVTIVIAALTISYQSIKAALANPSDALKNE